MAEPTVREDIADLRKTVQDGLQGLHIAGDRLAQKTGDLDRRIGELKADVTGRLDKVDENVKLLPGLKMMVGVVGTIVGLLVVVNGGVTGLNTSSLFGVHEKLGKFSDAADKLPKQVSDLKTSFDQMDAKLGKRLGDFDTRMDAFDKKSTDFDGKLGKRLTEFDTRLDAFGKKVDNLESAAALKTQLDQLSSNVVGLREKVDVIQGSLDANRRVRRVLDYRALREESRLREGRFAGPTLGIALPEGVLGGLVEEATAVFPAAINRQLGSPLTIVTRVDEKSSLLFVSIVGTRDEIVDQLLNSAEGLVVTITYTVREK